MTERTTCRDCGRSVAHVDAFGSCRKCAKARNDDGSYTIEGAIDDVMFPAVRERLHRELRRLRRDAERANVERPT